MLHSDLVCKHGSTKAQCPICRAEPKRCWHDGAFCHHHCPADAACWRHTLKMSLSTPYPGFPKEDK